MNASRSLHGRPARSAVRALTSRLLIGRRMAERKTWLQTCNFVQSAWDDCAAICALSLHVNDLGWLVNLSQAADGDVGLQETCGFHVLSKHVMPRF